MAHLTLGVGERHNNADSQPKDLLVDFLSQPYEFGFQGFPLSMCLRHGTLGMEDES
jgi:hypothetical protein